MDVALVPVGEGERAVVRALMQLYVYDFSEILPLHVEADGRFAERLGDAAWSDPSRQTFLIRVQGRWAGFAMVQRGSKLAPDTDVWDMAELFVMRGYRRAGIGEHVARTLFGMHPGAWEVRQRRENAAAVRFWRRVIHNHTAGDYTESTIDAGMWHGVVQRFVSHAP